MGVVGDRGPGVLQGSAMMDVSNMGPGGSAPEEVGLRVSVAKPRGMASGELERRKGGLERGKKVREL